VEDAAHAFGASYPDGSPVGSSGNLTCFSFYANKNISTGDGGAVCTNSGELAQRLRNLSNNGVPASAWKRFTDPRASAYPEFEQLGYKMNYIDLHAGIGRVQLRRFDSFRETRREIAGLYLSELGSLQPAIRFQAGLESERHARHLFVARLPVAQLKHSRDSFVQKMRDHNVGASVHYMPLHRMDYYRDTYGKQSLPQSEEAFGQLLTLPISASMTGNDARYVIKAMKAVYS
jgi:dTDP-4-amino-4,6-dideoxygalactose transaminase